MYKKILAVCVSLVLSLSFIVPLSLIGSIEVYAHPTVGLDVCEALESMTSSQSSTMLSYVSTSNVNLIFYDLSTSTLYWTVNGTFSGSLSAFKISGGKLWKMGNNDTISDYTGIINYVTFNLNNVAIYKFTGSFSGLTSFTYNSSACVVNSYTITVNATAGGSVSGGGSYTSKQDVTLTATPDDGYRFVQWSDGNTENPRTFKPTSDLSLTAEFEEIPYYNVVLSQIGNGQVIGSGRFEGGTEVTIEALPGVHYTFSMWSDGNTDNPRTFVLNENVNLTAVFLEDPKYKVDVEIFGKGSITGTGEYYGGTEVMLSAVPDEGYYFASWNDGSIDPTKFITVENDVTFAATFKQKSTAACTYSKDLVANPYVLKGVERAIKLVESNQIENYWWIYKRMYSFYLDIDGGYVPNGSAFVQPQSIEWILAYTVDDVWVYDSLGFEVNIPGYYSWVYYHEDGSETYHTLKLDAGINTGGERVDSEGNTTSFELVSRYDDITLLDAQCWQQGYDSNYYDLLQYYELKNANSNLVNNNNELTDINDNLSLIDRAIEISNDLLRDIDATAEIISENVISIWRKLDNVISGLFGVQYAVEDTNELLNQQIGLDQQQNQLIENGNDTSQSSAEKNDTVTSELTGSITQHNQIEKEYQDQMQEHISNVDFNLDLNGVSGFTTTATFISSSMDKFFNLDPGIKMMFTFPLIAGLAMLIIGRLKS